MEVKLKVLVLKNLFSFFYTTKEEMEVWALLYSAKELSSFEIKLLSARWKKWVNL